MNGMQRSIVIAWLLAGGLCATAAVAGHSHVRDGMVYGLYVGGGWTTLSATDITQNPPLERESDTSSDITGGLRLGYCPSKQFSWGIDISGWTGHDGWSGEAESDNFKATVYWILAQGHWYPGGGGFYLRGGIGLGSVGIKITDPSYTVSETTSGLGWTLGAGYEFRLSPKFALGALYDFRGADVGELTTVYDDVSASTQSFTVTLTWYTN